MHSTKTEILAHLKRHDGSTVDGVATSLNLAPMTVRQHLTALERDGVVRSEEVRRPTGRPHFRYKLTEDGHRRLSDGYDRLLALLVEQVGVLESNGVQEPEGRRERLFRAAAESLARRHAAELRGLAPADAADRATAILRRFGGFAEYHETPGAFELRDFGCVYRELVSGSGPCAWHETFLGVLFEGAVRMADDADTDTVAECAICCRYILSPHAGEMRPEPR
jgi:predicted ArsR family transcriptional regulator